MEFNFWDHLSELRRRLIKSVAALLIGFCLSLFLSHDLLNIITLPAGKLYFLHPTEALMAQLKVALTNGVVVSLPVILWQIGAFLWPALYPAERHSILFYFPFAFLLFCIGIFFGYYVVVRLGYQFLLSFATATIQPMITLSSYLSFVLSSMLLCGLVFLMPVLVLFLARIGILKAAFLWRQQRSIIIGLAVLIAVITPTVDFFSMLLVFIPVLVLFEFSILLAWQGERRRAAKQLG